MRVLWVACSLLEILIIRLITWIIRFVILITRIVVGFIRLKSQYPAKFNSYLTFRSNERKKPRPRLSRRRQRQQRRQRPRLGRRQRLGHGWSKNQKQWDEAGAKILKIRGELNGTSSSPASERLAEDCTELSNKHQWGSCQIGTLTGSPPSTTHPTDGRMIWTRLPMPGGSTRIKPEGLRYLRASMAAWPHSWSTLVSACASWSTRWRTRCELM